MKQFFLKMRKLKDSKRPLLKKKHHINRQEKNLLILKRLTNLLKIEWKMPSPKKKNSKKKIENIFIKSKA